MAILKKFRNRQTRESCRLSRSLAGPVLSFLLFALFSLPGEGFCESKVAVLVSRNILPYTEAVEGFGEALSESGLGGMEVFSFENFPGKKRELLSEKLGQNHFELFVVIGPEAARFLRGQALGSNAGILYSMVLNPGEIVGGGRDVCGVSLSIPVQAQLAEISLAVPSIKRIGLIFDPEFNEAFFEEARRKASALGVEIVPLRVLERKSIPKVLKSGLDSIDGLWMIPDRTVISESIVQYIIKEALLRSKPAFGYNSFFYESGALLAFVFDYRELGRQAGRMAVLVLGGEHCIEQPPRFQTWVNEKVADRLGLEILFDKRKAGAGP